MKRSSLVKSSKRIKQLLKDRFKEAEKSLSEVIMDANLRGMRFTIASLSKYLNYDSPEGGLSEEGIIWLCFRYGINVHLLVGTPVIKDGHIDLQIVPYNEQDSLKKLDTVFPNLKKQHYGKVK